MASYLVRRMGPRGQRAGCRPLEPHPRVATSGRGNRRAASDVRAPTPPRRSSREARARPRNGGGPTRFRSRSSRRARGRRGPGPKSARSRPRLRGDSRCPPGRVRMGRRREDAVRRVHPRSDRRGRQQPLHVRGDRFSRVPHPPARWGLHFLLPSWRPLAGNAAGIEVGVLLMRQAAAPGGAKVRSRAHEGPNIQRNASGHKAMSYGYMKKEAERLREDIESLVTQAQQQDESDDAALGSRRGDELPSELKRREDRLTRIESAMRRLEAQAKAEAEAERKRRTEAEAERIRAGKPRRGKGPKPVEE